MINSFKVNSMGPCLQRISATILLALLPGVASAHPFTIDQFNNPQDPLAVLIQQPPLGQEFTPTLTSLDVVELLIMDSQPFDDLGSSITVNIRADSILGPVLGSSTLVLPDVYGGGTFASTHFDFPITVPLVPGNTFVIELIEAGLGFTVAVNPSNSYSGGRFIVGGRLVEGSDLVFREGPAESATVPEPSATMLLFGVGAAVTRMARMKRGQSRRNDS